MNIESPAYREMLAKRPLNVQAAWGEEPVALVSGRDIFEVAKERDAIVLAANARNPLTIRGVLAAAKKLNAAVLIELAKSESTYCASTYENMADYAVKYSAELGHGVVFGLHMDHYAIKSDEDRLKAVSHVRSVLERGWTSVAIDASHVPDWRNLCYTRDVAMHIPAYIGLEVEVGEIKGAGEVSTPEEAVFFLGGLNAWGIFPDLLAISNGSLHGTYDPSMGQVEGIDLEATLAVAQAIRPYGASIAQHGISGTPLDKCGQFTKYGINKGNVATLFQNIVFGLKMDPETGNALTENGAYVKEADRGIPVELWEKMVAWADGKGYSRKDGNYKKANMPFGDEIMALPAEYHDRIVAETQEWAERFIRAFKAEGTADLVMERLASREDHNCAPERTILHRRSEFTAEKAPDYTSGKSGDGQDYSD